MFSLCFLTHTPPPAQVHAGDRTLLLDSPPLWSTAALAADVLVGRREREREGVCVCVCVGV